VSWHNGLGNSQLKSREIARLKSALEKTKSELRNAKSSIQALRSCQQKELRLEKPAEMLNADYAAKLGDAFRIMFTATRLRKRKMRLAKDCFDTLQKDTVMKELIDEFKKKPPMQQHVRSVLCSLADGS
jgi:hypothetical protein